MVIEGPVSSEGVPQIQLEVAGRAWTAIIDTGFNGYLELPSELKDALNAVYFGQIVSSLAGGQQLEEAAYYVEFPFDGDVVIAEATFVEGEEILVGTRIMLNHELAIDFPARSLRLERASSIA